jgi:hypothetical protein
MVSPHIIAWKMGNRGTSRAMVTVGVWRYVHSYYECSLTVISLPTLLTLSSTSFLPSHPTLHRCFISHRRLPNISKPQATHTHTFKFSSACRGNSRSGYYWTLNAQYLSLRFSSFSHSSTMYHVTQKPAPWKKIHQHQQTIPTFDPRWNTVSKHSPYHYYLSSHVTSSFWLMFLLSDFLGGDRDGPLVTFCGSSNLFLLRERFF